MSLLGSVQDGIKNNVQFNPKYMRDNCSTWNLSNDVELLKHLERFTETILRNTAIAGKCMDELEDSLNLTYLKVRSISNEFHLVGDTQFVENRAHDEDENVQESSEKTDCIDLAESTSPVNTKLEDSISTCIRLLEDKFETIQLSESDSDDEELEHSQVVIKPRKCYVERPLPHIIGSHKFLNDSTLGLSLSLQEPEDSTETEDEGGNIFTNIIQNNSDGPSQTEQCSASNSFSRKSREDSVSSYDMIAGNEFFQENQHGFNNVIHDNQVEDENLDDEVSVTTPSTSLFVQTRPIDSLSQTSDSKSMFSEKNIAGEKLEPKPYTKERMKSLLEQIYSSHQDNLFSKTKSKEDKMEVVVEPVAETVDKMENVNRGAISKKLSTSTAASTTRPSVSSSNQIEPSTELVADDALPNVPTRILHSLSKNRVRNQNKRRLPTRKKHDNAGYTVSSDNVPKEPLKSLLNEIDLIAEPKKKNIASEHPILNESNNVPSLLSPSTDEEDLFTVCNSNTPTDSSTDRLFEPLSFTQSTSTFGISSLKTEQSSSETCNNQSSSSFWDPFAEDDENEPLFQDTTSWSSHKFKKRSRNLLGDLDSSPPDNNLFTKTNTSATLLFAQEAGNNSKSIESSLLFDETDEDSLFTSINKNKNNDATRPSFNDSERKTCIADINKSASSSSNIPSKNTVFKSTTNFLNDPLGFSHDSEND